MRVLEFSSSLPLCANSQKHFLLFPDTRMEARFFAEYVEFLARSRCITSITPDVMHLTPCRFLQSDAHYQTSRWAFYLFTALYFAYACLVRAFYCVAMLSRSSRLFDLVICLTEPSQSTLSRSSFGLLFADDADALRTLVVPFLNFLIFAMVRLIHSTVIYRVSLSYNENLLRAHFQASVLAHKKSWRKYAHLELILIIPMGTWRRTRF